MQGRPKTRLKPTSILSSHRNPSILKPWIELRSQRRGRGRRAGAVRDATATESLGRRACKGASSLQSLIMSEDLGIYGCAKQIASDKLQDTAGMRLQ